MIAIPNSLKDLPHVNILLDDGHSCILQKQLQQASLDRKGYIARHVLSCIIQGEQHIISEDGSAVTIKEGEAAFISRGIYTISDLIPDGGAFESYLFFFDQQRWDQWVVPKRGESKENRPFLSFMQARGFAVYLESMLKLLPLISGEKEHFLELKLAELLLLFRNDSSAFDQYIQQIPLQPNRSLKPFLEAHYDKPLKVEDYAYLTGRSLSSFRRDFKRIFNATPQRWLIEKRMEKAASLLRASNMQVVEVAKEVGYDNVSHFIQEFKKIYDQTPSSYG